MEVEVEAEEAGVEGKLTAVQVWLSVYLGHWRRRPQTLPPLAFPFVRFRLVVEEIPYQLECGEMSLGRREVKNRLSTQGEAASVDPSDLAQLKWRSSRSQTGSCLISCAIRR